MSGPSTIYTPKPLSISNFDFELAGAAPGPNWQVGGLGIAAASSVAYDTSTPYEGAQSLIVNSDGASLNEGVSSVAQYSVVPGEVYRISVAVMVNSGAVSGAAQFSFVDKNGSLVGTPIRATISSPAAWTVATGQGTVPFGAVAGIISLIINQTVASQVEFDVVQITRLSTAIPYYLGLLTSQYQNSPNLKAFAAMLLQPFVDTAICAASLSDAFSLADAVGPQLDALGVIIGASRTLPFNPVGFSALTTAAITAGGFQAVPVNNTNYIVLGQQYTITGSDGHTETITIGSYVPGVSISSTFFSTHVSGSSITGAVPSAVLSDADYRILLQAKVLQNRWDGQAGSLWQPWQAIFPGGHIYITDNQNMTATIFLLGAFTTIQQQMITNGLIVPRPQGVQYAYTFPVLPLFGFDNLNPAFVRGFDIGRWD